MDQIDSYIPSRYGSNEVLFENAPVVGRVDFMDGVIAFSPSIIFLLIGDGFLPWFLEPYTIVFSLLMLGAGGLLLIFKPKYMTLSEWFSVRREFSKRENELKKNYTNSNGKPFESYSAVPDDDARKLTEVERVYPIHDLIELQDGKMIGMIEFSGSNLDMAPQEMLLNVVNSYKRTISTQLEYDIQFYLPMRPVSMESSVEVYIDELERRQNKNSEDISDTFMEQYLQDRASWVSSLGEESFIREFYVIVKMDKIEVYEDQVSGRSNLTELPAGDILEEIRLSIKGQSGMQSEEEIKRKQIREMRDRLNSVGSILSSGPENSFEIVPSQKSVALLKEFWEGEKILDDEMDALSVEYPFVTESDELTEFNGGDE